MCGSSRPWCRSRKAELAAVSVEAGHQLTNEGSRWFVEPQIQAQYNFVSDNDYSNGQTKVEQDDIHPFITRAGFRVGKWFDETKSTSVYFKGDVLHEWADDQDIHVLDKTTNRVGDTISLSNHCCRRGLSGRSGQECLRLRRL